MQRRIVGSQRDRASQQLDGLIVIEVVGEIERAESKLAARFSRRLGVVMRL